MRAAVPGLEEALALHAQRLQLGWRAIGRKIGLTNRSIWPKYGVHEPIWGTVYDRTVRYSAAGAVVIELAGLAHPRIEPEICFRLKSAVEIVQCESAGWKGNVP